MGHDVFISYSTKDKNAADAACSVLERNGIRCWIAPRDVTPGAVWGGAIVGAIREARIMVLVFSGAANTSPQIEREVERAISTGIPVIPLRIEDVQPKEALEYFISASHWLDAFSPPLEQHLETLARVVRQFLEFKAQDGSRPSAKSTTRADAADVSLVGPLDTPPRPTAIQPAKRRLPIIVALSAGVLLCAALAAVYAARHLLFDTSHPVGEPFRDCTGCPQMVVVPAGRLTMGASSSERSEFDAFRAGEGPVHEVRIAQPFAVGVYAVTRDEFEEFVGETGHPVDGGCSYWDGKEVLDLARSFRNPKLGGGAQAGDHPVVCVSPREAAQFAAWLSAKSGYGYRLLSDAEREYVTRAGTTSTFWWGWTISPDRANYWSDASWRGSPTVPARWSTVPVKSYAQNPWGLYQVHGNVAEWVADCWHATYDGAPSDGSAWEAGADCKERTLRGGAFLNNADFLRSAHRRPAPSDLREIAFGFRVARTLGR